MIEHLQATQLGVPSPKLLACSCSSIVSTSELKTQLRLEMENAQLKAEKEQLTAQIELKAPLLVVKEEPDD